jgi:hypothetical protein
MKNLWWILLAIAVIGISIFGCVSTSEQNFSFALVDRDYTGVYTRVYCMEGKLSESADLFPYLGVVYDIEFIKNPPCEKQYDFVLPKWGFYVLIFDGVYKNWIIPSEGWAGEDINFIIGMQYGMERRALSDLIGKPRKLDTNENNNKNAVR